MLFLIWNLIILKINYFLWRVFFNVYYYYPIKYNNIQLKYSKQKKIFHLFTQNQKKTKKHFYTPQFLSFKSHRDNPVLQYILPLVHCSDETLDLNIRYLIIMVKLLYLQNICFPENFTFLKKDFNIHTVRINKNDCFRKKNTLRLIYT